MNQEALEWYAVPAPHVAHMLRFPPDIVMSTCYSIHCNIYFQELWKQAANYPLFQQLATFDKYGFLYISGEGLKVMYALLILLYFVDHSQSNDSLYKLLHMIPFISFQIIKIKFSLILDKDGGSRGCPFLFLKVYWFNKVQMRPPLFFQ